MPSARLRRGVPAPNALALVLAILLLLLPFVSAHGGGGPNPYPRDCTLPSAAAGWAFMGSFIGAIAGVSIPTRITGITADAMLETVVIWSSTILSEVYAVLAMLIFFKILDEAINPTPKRMKGLRWWNFVLLVVGAGFALETAGFGIYYVVNSDNKFNSDCTGDNDTTATELSTWCVEYMNQRVLLIGTAILVILLELVRFFATRKFLKRRREVHDHPTPKRQYKWDHKSEKLPTSLDPREHWKGGRGQAVAYGAEARLERFSEAIADRKLVEAKCFKLLLHPPEMRGRGAQKLELTELPPNVDVQKCYADMIRYVYDCTRQWFIENTPDGEMLWRKLGGVTKIVVGYPNGWTLPEQEVITQAVFQAGLLSTENDKNTRLLLVTEAEASVHFGMLHAEDQTDGWLEPGSSFAVCDAGGSTVDTCCYTVESVSPRLKLRESKLSDCVQAGAIFVTANIEAIIKRKLGNSACNTPEFVVTMVEQFDLKTKILFSDPSESHVIKFGFESQSDRAVGISRGRLTLTGAEVEEAFTPCIITVDEPSKKAVAEGAVIYFEKDSVVARATRFEFGICTNRPYSPELAHGRIPIMFTSGKKYFTGGWSPLVRKGQVIQNDVVHAERFWVHKRPGDSLTFTTTITTFAGDNGLSTYGGWSTAPDGNLYPGFAQCCKITGDLAPLASITPIQRAANGDRFRELDFAVGIFFGQATLRACLIYQHNGQEIRGPATIIPANFV
ncbi:hypothetical protein MNV49_006210 [Pseudohyphozyma bogoriensis]|nr:hypothetical protein MNV49_006210 [Pseudohyphozyma bogoriensis]